MDNIDNLLLEHLKRFQAGQERIEQKLDELTQRMGQLEVGIAGLKKEIAHGDESDALLSVRFDRLSSRVERIERRLELNA